MEKLKRGKRIGKTNRPPSRKASCKGNYGRKKEEDDRTIGEASAVEVELDVLSLRTGEKWGKGV